MQIRHVTLADDLVPIVQQMQPDKWAKDNDMSSYQLESLKAFLEKDGLLVLAYEGDKITGVAMCYRLPHPSGEHHLYVHELDTHPEFRRQGIGAKLMEKVFEIGRTEGFSEVWVATETDNNAANGLYTKLKPTEVEQSVTYSYEVK